MKVLQELHTKINKQERPLRIQGLLKKRKETLEEFLVKLFTKWNLEKQTLYSDTAKEVKEVQTEPGKRRSIGDILLIARHYYPRCTLRQITEIVYGQLFEKVPRFRSSFCSTIKKRVFYKGADSQATALLDTNVKDEHGFTVDEWKEHTKS